MAITAKRGEIGMWLLLDTNRKSSMRNSTATLDLTLSDHGRSNGTVMYDFE